MTNMEYEEFYCIYCDSQRCHIQKGESVEEKCPYYGIRVKPTDDPVTAGTGN